MDNQPLSRHYLTLPIILLCLAIAAFTARYASSLLVTTVHCGPGCLFQYLFHGPWLNHLARGLFCAAAVMVLWLSPGKQRKHTAIARFWPAYYLVILAALLMLWIQAFNHFVASGYETGHLSVLDKLKVIFLGMPLLQVILVGIIAWAPISLTCFRNTGSPVARSRNRQALIFFLAFTSILVALSTWSLDWQLLFAHGDLAYALLKNSRELGIQLGWSLLASCVLLGLPAWGVAWLRDSGGRGTKGTLIGACLAFLFGLAITLITLAVLVLSAPPHVLRHPSGLVHLAWCWAFAGLVGIALMTWLSCEIVRPARPGIRVFSLQNSHRLGLTTASVLVAFATFYVVVTIIAAKNNWTGAQPPKTVIAKDPAYAGQMGIPDGNNCSGVVRAGNHLWLLGYNDRPYISKLKKKKSVINLAAGKAGGKEHRSKYVTFYAGVTVISRLTPQKTFKPVAYLPGKACLVGIPDSKRMLLFTSLRRLDKNASNHVETLFESRDAGHNWHAIDAGMFAQVSNNMAQLHVDFRSKDQVWAWRSPYAEPKNRRMFLAVSEDGGKTADTITIPPNFASGKAAIEKLHPGATRISTKDPYSGKKYYITGHSTHQAIVWLSQEFNYTLPGDTHQHIARITDAVRLRRTPQGWKGKKVRHFPGLYIDRLSQSGRGPAYAVVQNGSQPGNTIARLDSHSMRWKHLPAPPNPLWPMGHGWVSEFWASEDAIVAGSRGRFRPPQTTDKGDIRSITISAKAFYFSSDQGKSWHKLAIRHYPGVLGLDGENDQLYFQNFSHHKEMSPIFGYDLGS